FRTTSIASDNCGGVTLTQSPAPGTLVGTGPHPVTVTATDGSNNSTNCGTSFTVNDVTPPSITMCAPAQSANAGSGTSCTAPVPDFTASTVASDNCGSVTITQSPLAGTQVGIGP